MVSKPYLSKSREGKVYSKRIQRTDGRSIFVPQRDGEPQFGMDFSQEYDMTHEKNSDNLS